MLILKYVGVPFLSLFFFFNDTATTEIYTLSLHDALPISSSTNKKRLHQELIQDLPPRRPDRLADSDFARSLCYRHQHDVHDTDSADEQGDGCNNDQHERQGERNVPCCPQDGRQRLHLVRSEE